jgi:hypothetical protein
MPRFGRFPRRDGPPLFPGRRRPFGAVRPLPPGPTRALARAHQLFAAGQFDPAAEQFEMLAKAAHAGKVPFAPRLFFQAARANWHAGNYPHGMELLRYGLEILVAAGAYIRIRQIAQAAMGELETLGHPQEAEQIKQYLDGIPGVAQSAASIGANAPSPAEEARPILPATCGQCGAVVRPEEVEWIDPRTAGCAFCGSPIRPEKE